MAARPLAERHLAALAAQCCLLVLGDHRLRLAVAHDLALLQPDDPVAEARHRGHVVRHEQDREAALRFLSDPLQAPLLERDVPHRQDLVGEQDIRLHADSHGERQAQVHAARVLTHRIVHEIMQLSELDDLGHAFERLTARNPVHRGVHQDVVVRGKVRVESGAELEQRNQAAVTDRAPFARPGDAREDLEQRRLSCAVGADNPEDRAVGNRERRVSKGPQVASPGGASGKRNPRQRHACKTEIQHPPRRRQRRLLRRHEISLAEVFDDQAVHRSYRVRCAPARAPTCRNVW